MANQPMAAGFLSENGYSAADDVYDIEMLIGLTVVAPLFTFNAYFDCHMCRTSLTVIWRRETKDDSQQPAMTMVINWASSKASNAGGPYYRRRSINHGGPQRNAVLRCTHHHRRLQPPSHP